MTEEEILELKKTYNRYVEALNKISELSKQILKDQGLRNRDGDLLVTNNEKLLCDLVNEYILEATHPDEE